MKKINQPATRQEPPSTVVSFSDPLPSSTLEYLRARFPDAFDTDPPMLRGAIIQQWVRHGTGGCRCQRGYLHGAYYYLFDREKSGRLRKRYIRQADVPHVRALVERHQAAMAQKRASRRRWAEAYHLVKQHLRDTDQMMNDFLRANK